jgi:hypothetical protein
MAAITANEALAKVGLTTETVTKRILRTFGKASEQDVLEGKSWYDEARAIVRNLATFSDFTEDQIASAMAQLSPRLRWKQNVDSIIMLVNDGELPAYVMTGPANRARRSLVAAEPFDTFGKAAKKTRSFARNIVGDTNAVTVDVWAARVAGIDESQLKLVGVYEAVAHCYRLAAKRAGIDPQQMQAITWIVIRGSAN